MKTCLSWFTMLAHLFMVAKTSEWKYSTCRLGTKRSCLTLNSRARADRSYRGWASAMRVSCCRSTRKELFRLLTFRPSFGHLCSTSSKDTQKYLRSCGLWVFQKMKCWPLKWLVTTKHPCSRKRTKSDGTRWRCHYWNKKIRTLTPKS